MDSNGTPQGYFALVLHAHLPFVRHPELPRFMEEDWLFEGITETYLPLLDAFESLERDGVHFRLTMSLTPPLVSMLTDELLQERYEAYLDDRIRLAGEEMGRQRGSPELYPLAEMYYDIFTRSRHRFTHGYGRDLVQAFRGFQDRGSLEIITCGATHGFLPHMKDPVLQRAQIEVAVEQYHEHFGRGPVGIWLPECAYVPGVEELLAPHGIRYFLVENHGILDAEPQPVHGVYAPLLTSSGVAAFGRDTESAHQVWSRDSGYPGDVNYREFYRDVGFDLPQEEVAEYLHSPDIRHMLGMKYYRITGDTHDKATYHPGWARDRAAEHAGDFLNRRGEQARRLRPLMDRPPMVVSPYDAELFGHWWYEGPQFLEFLFRKMHHDQDAVAPITPGEYLQRHPVNQIATPAMSSWGANGTFEVWLNGSNDWIYPHLNKAGERMRELATRYTNADGTLRRALNQAARELLLAQSSDWAFIMTMDTTVRYAVQRTKSHVARFTKLYEDITRGTLDLPWIEEIEGRDNIFPHMQYEAYGDR
jgi:1,4-alpha-glucan branching enzyme